jgi:hypothetical protein
VRIGEISAALERAPSGPGRGKKSLPVNGKTFKAEVLRSAGLSTSVAHRAEQLAAHAPKVEAYIAKKARPCSASDCGTIALEVPVDLPASFPTQPSDPPSAPAPKLGPPQYLGNVANPANPPGWAQELVDNLNRNVAADVPTS